MSAIMILDEDRDREAGYSLRVQPDRGPAVHIMRSLLIDYVQVIVENASHKAWGGIGGKRFANLDLARKHYKSPGVRAAIDLFEIREAGLMKGGQS